MAVLQQQGHSPGGPHPCPRDTRKAGRVALALGRLPVGPGDQDSELKMEGEASTYLNGKCPKRSWK